MSLTLKYFSNSVEEVVLAKGARLLKWRSNAVFLASARRPDLAKEVRAVRIQDEDLSVKPARVRAREMRSFKPSCHRNDFP